MSARRKRKRVYFFWDYDLSEEDVRAILAGDDARRKAWVISRLLNAAFWDDIWKYITLDDIIAHWDMLRFRTPYQRELWEYAIKIWTQKGDGRGKTAGRGETSVAEERARYLTDPEPELHSGILSPLQEDFLRRFFAYDVGRSFFLTGGTALAAFYLHHRLSEDLDIFTVEDEPFSHLEAETGRLGRELNCEVYTLVSTPAFRQVLVKTDGGDELKIDFVRDVDAQFGQQRWASGVRVDSLLNIAVSKVIAVFGRADIKDFVDLYYLLRRGFEIETLFALAKEKDRGFTPFYFAGMLRQIRTFREGDLPTMLEPLDLDALIAFYEELADRLLARHAPLS